ncbi:MAG: DUF1592 domain-containing protein [Deltaproteobacteria bacterium]|nr:DUF1592 domain-containing protein [Deltaproteobacteria bacterium]
MSSSRTDKNTTPVPVCGRLHTAIAGCLAAAVLFLSAAGAQAAPAKPLAPAAAKKILRQYCAECHGGQKAKGGMRIDALDLDVVGGRHGERWHDVLTAIETGDMPPEESRQLPQGERTALAQWLRDGLQEAARLAQSEAASVLRRLTREQYTNTLRDLLGVDTDYTRMLPPESPSRMGMQNDGRSLASSTLHLEQTMKVARVAVDRALSLGDPPAAWRFRVTFGPQVAPPGKPVDLGYQAQPLAPEQFRVETFAGTGPARTPTLTPRGELRDRVYVDLRGSHDYDSKKSSRRYQVDERGLVLAPAKPHVERAAQIWQGPNPNLGLVLRDFPSEGSFVLRVRVARTSGQGDSPWLRAFVGNRLDDGMEYATFDRSRRVDAPPGQPQTIEFRGRLENLPVPIVDPNDREFLSNLMVIGVWNDALVTQAGITTPALAISSIEFEGPITDAWPSASHRAIFFDDQRLAEPERYADEILERFLTRAFRRPPTPAQLERYRRFFRERRRANHPFAEAMRDTLVAALSSPYFLHHFEPVEAAAPRLDPYALANRLSYFLWNTMPDEGLFAAAREGTLVANLEQHVRRMLASPRARDSFAAFAAQWLDLGALDRVRVNVKKFPAFNRFIKDDLRTETMRYVEWAFRENRPLRDLIAGDHVMVNQNLAGFYGVPGVVGPEFRPVPWHGAAAKGGLLTQGSFLVGHSTGTESHPIKRGYWVARKLLDKPPPPPPPNVPEIDHENPAIARMTVKEQLALHRDRDSCRNCHKNLDPWGLPLESFDAQGLNRSTIERDVLGEKITLPVDATSTLPDGTEIAGIAGLQHYLADTRLHDVRRAVARHLAAYALGRTPGFIEESALAEICERTVAEGDGLAGLVVALVTHDIFTSK